VILAQLGVLGNLDAVLQPASQPQVDRRAAA
jgi:hypothetical protein